MCKMVSLCFSLRFFVYWWGWIIYHVYWLCLYLVPAQDVSLVVICLLLFPTQPSIAFFPLQIHLEHSFPSVVKQLPYILGLFRCSHLCLHLCSWLAHSLMVSQFYHSLQAERLTFPFTKSPVSQPLPSLFLPLTSSLKPFCLLSWPVPAFYQTPPLEEWVGCPLHAHTWSAAGKNSHTYPDMLTRWFTPGFLHLCSSSEIGLWGFFLWAIFLRLPHHSYACFLVRWRSFPVFLCYWIVFK